MVTSLDLMNHFGFRIVNSDLESLNRVITIPEIDRAGAELLGYFQFHRKDRLIVIGNKEMHIINNSPKDKIDEYALLLCDPMCPGIIITQGSNCPSAFLKASEKTHCPIFLSESDTNDLLSRLYIYLSEVLAPKIAMHACLLDIFGVGVLLLGDSGIGKSEISLGLIKKGHRLVADDRVDVREVNGTLIGTCPESIYGMMEVRGIGIIDVARMFGINSLEKRAEINLVISLVPFEQTEPLERIGMKTERYEILGETIPIVKLPISAARSMAEIIEAAVTNYKLKDYGYDTGYEFQKRLNEIQNKRLMEQSRLKEVVASNSNKKKNIDKQDNMNTGIMPKDIKKENNKK